MLKWRQEQGRPLVLEEPVGVQKVSLALACVSQLATCSWWECSHKRDEISFLGLYAARRRLPPA